MYRRLWFYNPPGNGVSAEELAAYTDVVCMTMGEEREEFLREMRKAGFKGEIWLYWLQNSVHAVADPNRNNVGYQPGTFDELLKRDPDVFQYTLDNEIVRKNDKRDYVVCDVAHPGWQKLFKERTIETVQRNPDLWTGIWDDDLNVVFHVNAVGTVETRKYGKPDSPAYYEAFNGWLTHQRDEITAPLGLRFGGNLQGSDLVKWKKSAAIMAKNNGSGRGVVTNEFQFLSHEGEYLSEDEWKKDLEKVKSATESGAEVWNVCPIDAKEAFENPGGAEAKKIDFFIASHVLATDVHAAYRIGRNYAQAFRFKVHDELKKLGKAKGKYVYHELTGAYTRDFEGGKVRVVPGAKTAEITYTPIVEPPPTEEPPQEEKPPVITIEGLSITVEKISVHSIADLVEQLQALIYGALAGKLKPQT